MEPIVILYILNFELNFFILKINLILLGLITSSS
jgi:hypothetical protein